MTTFQEVTHSPVWLVALAAVALLVWHDRRRRARRRDDERLLHAWGVWDNEGRRDMIYYVNGGPGSASKLIRIHLGDGNLYSMKQWRKAKAESWQPKTGWRPDSFAQLSILGTGEFLRIDDYEVADIQRQMVADWERAKSG